ncbi:hypothetical protein P43SY_008323 [Pythium insidiosum]|uniref:2'-phosphotransferase n=1 Tax=Pythium insidiosum TaxID=114742 RepID=A0AAD5LF61_PYTIN|nr:hypothetical protein P43SY_008323 [Pythium insidiosum]
MATPEPATHGDATSSTTTTSKRKTQRQPRCRLRGRKDDSPEVRLSKTLSYALRHGAVELGLEMRASGFVALQEILRLPVFRSVDEAQVEAIVRMDAKNRFTLTTDASGAIKYIRANQGHTLSIVVDDELLTPITDACEVSKCIHGTYSKFWASIWSTGLCRMARNHIHMTPNEVPTGTVISGMRTNCDVLIYVDVALALQDGIKFYRSSNNVILSPGAGDAGVIERKYFARVLRRDGSVLYERAQE